MRKQSRKGTFKVSAEVKGLQNVTSILRRKTAWALKNEDVSAVAGYDQRYALYVHEDLTKTHKNGTVKYLVMPAFIYRKDIFEEIFRLLRLSETMTFARALLAGANKLLNYSKQQVPVDTGALRASGFTAIEKGPP